VNVTDNEQPNPNAEILADLQAKAERHAHRVDLLFGGPQPQPSHDRETEIKENGTDE
jgi:hypothetical protein